MSMPTIQLEVDMMEKSASGKSKVSKRDLKRGRNGTLATGPRPSRQEE